MKTRDLIAKLQKADPSGELECCVGNADIHFVDKQPGYYDGCLQVLKRDPDSEYYNIIGGEYRSKGDKIKLHTLSIHEAIWNAPDMPVTFDGEYTKEHYAAGVEQCRQEVRDCDKEIAAEKQRKVKV